MWRNGIICYWIFVIPVHITIAFFYVDDVTIILIAIAIFIMLCMAMVRFNPSHPVTWLLPVMFLYQYSAVIAELMGWRYIENTFEVSSLGWIALCTTAWILLLFGTRHTRGAFISGSNHFPVSKTTLRLLLIILSFIALIFDIWFLINGFASKRLFILQASSFSVLKSVFPWLIFIYIFELIRSTNETKKIPKRLIAGIGLLFLFSGLLLGERDLILSLIIVTGLALYDMNIIGKPIVLGLAVLGILLVPILDPLKTVFTRGNIETSRILQKPIERIMTGEFSAVGNNLDIIITNFGNHYQPYLFFSGETILWDIGRTLFPSFILHVPNATSWFNNTYFPKTVAAGGGKGFSFAAEGFVNFGYLGVILWHIILGGIVLILYNRNLSRHSIVVKAVYFAAVPLLIYAIRGDFSYILSPFLKQIGLPLLLISIVNRLLPYSWRKRNKVKG